jgi:sporulation protein YlmC with PRC-barrel domain
MLRSIDELIGYTIEASDGDIGKVSNFLFDDELWTIRYLVANTGNWLVGRQVLIAPVAFYDKPKWESERFPLVLTKKMVEESPDITEDEPVSRQKESEIVSYYHWPVYWYPEVRTSYNETIKTIKKDEEDNTDSHLRSVQEVQGYHIEVIDGSIGHVEDFIIDDDKWEIMYLVVDTRNWLPGRKVIVSRTWIDKVSWLNSKVTVDLNKEAIKMSPEFDPSAPINREYEEVLYDYYGRPKYWAK